MKLLFLPPPPPPSMSTILHFTIFFFFFFFASTSVQQRLLEESNNDVYRLLAFRSAISGDPTGLLTKTWINSGYSRTPSLCPASFHGVTCDQGAKAVISISLDNLGLTGDVSFEVLRGMASLQNLTLSNNKLTGVLSPSSVSSLTSLRILDLSYNRFSGAIPQEIAGLFNLSFLKLSFNNFSGEFPVGLEALGKLSVVDVRGNSLQGDVAGVLGELRNTDYIDLSGNFFSGELWLEHYYNYNSSAGNLMYLDLSWNELQGRFFSTEMLPLFQNLIFLDVSFNNLTGELPNFDNLRNLKFFWARSNWFYGNLPVKFFEDSGTTLVNLDISSNKFSGFIPNISSEHLKVLNISTNDVLGLLPPAIGNCIILDFSKNRLYGNLLGIEKWISPSIEFLDLSSNFFSEKFPLQISHLKSLIHINVRNNSLRGSLPSSVFEAFTNLSTIDLSDNKFTGPLPTALFMSANLKTIHLSGNFFSGIIPIIDDEAVISNSTSSSGSSLESLDLSDNSLFGTLTSGIIYLHKLKFLRLRRNSLSGSIPTEIESLGFLEYLDLSVNQFQGLIPKISQSSLMMLNLSYNNLSGSVPENLTRFPDSSFHPGNSLLGYPSPATSSSSSSSYSDISGMYSTDQVEHKKSRSGFVIALICIGVTTFIVVLVGVSVHAFQHLKEKEEITSVSRDLNLGTKSSKIFKYDHLMNIARFQNERQLSPSHPSDQLVGKLCFFNNHSPIVFSVEELSNAPAQVVGRGSHGTSYKAILKNGHSLIAKRIRFELAKPMKDFAKEMKRIGSINHQNIVPLRAYYYGSNQQEHILLSDYVDGNSLAWHLHGERFSQTKRSRISLRQRLNIVFDVARCLCFLHEAKSVAHGNLKATNIFLIGPDLTAKLTDYGLHHLITPSSNVEMMLSMGAHGYKDPDQKDAFPCYGTDVYAFGVLVMEILTRKSAGDIISGEADAVDLVDWVRKYGEAASKSKARMEFFDADISNSADALSVMNKLLGVSLQCILPVNERPDISCVARDLSSITIR